MTSIGFLHTSAVHVPTFDRLVAELIPDAEVVTVVDELLLDRARTVGPRDLEVLGAIADRLAQLAEVDRIICTCSTIGGVAEWIGGEAGLSVTRVDRPMAEVAVGVGGRIAVLAAVESTLGPTTELLRDAANGADLDVAVTLVEGAWDRFERGDAEGYLAVIATAIEAAAVEADVVVLAQASMADATDRVDVAVPVLSSPRLAVRSLM